MPLQWPTLPPTDQNQPSSPASVETQPTPTPNNRTRPLFGRTLPTLPSLNGAVPSRNAFQNIPTLPGRHEYPDRSDSPTQPGPSVQPINGFTRPLDQHLPIRPPTPNNAQGTTSSPLPPSRTRRVVRRTGIYSFSDSDVLVTPDLGVMPLSEAEQWIDRGYTLRDPDTGSPLLIDEIQEDGTRITLPTGVSDSEQRQQSDVEEMMRQATDAQRRREAIEASEGENSRAPRWSLPEQ